MTWDLATLDNWDLLLSEGRVAQNPIRVSANYRTYEPIPAFFAAPYSQTLLVGCQSSTAKEHWFLGARASQFLYVNPSLSSNFISGVQAGESQKCGLNHLTLVEFKDHNVAPYALELKIPYWLEDIYIEVWEYNGDIGGSQYEFDTSDIIERLQRIESKVDIDNTWGNQ